MMVRSLRNKSLPIGRRGNSSGKKASLTLRNIRFFGLGLLAFLLFFYHYVTTTLELTNNDDLNDGGLKATRVTKVKDEYSVEVPIDQYGEKPEEPKAVIAYAISLTDCGKSGVKSYVEGASVLRHSIHLSSYENYEGSGSLYSYKLFAFVHPEAEKCAGQLKTLGFNVMIKDTPIDTDKIKGEFLREHVVRSGCCGAKEFLKLYTYTLTDYPVAVHLDMDALILKPFDVLFDAMIEGNEEQRKTIQQLSHDKKIEVPQQIDAYFTRDYNMINPGKKPAGAQGGFLIFRPSMDIFNEHLQVILKGDFKKGRGWGGTHGGFFGAQQIQGLTPYFYDILHPNTAVELNRCYFNSMNDNPRQKNKKTKEEKCRTGETTCQDCRETNFEDIHNVHFTICQKPWECHGHFMNLEQQHTEKKLCHHFHKAWFNVRKDFENSYLPSIIPNYKRTTHETKDPAWNEFFHGVCKYGGNSGYIPINLNK